MSKLDTNTKMIVSKYLCGKNFTDFVNAFKLQNYYFTTFNYITINKNITKQSVKKIKHTLQLFPNLNEIILNFVTDSYIIFLNMVNIIKCCIKFQDLKNKIKFRIVDENFNEYKEVYVVYYERNYYEIF